MNIRELFESTKKVAVVAFGRLNPPTVGHEKLIKEIMSHPGDHYLYVSHTQNKKDNPLTYDQKVKYISAFFPGITIGSSSVRTPIDMMKDLQAKGYTDVIYIAGSDRVDSFRDMLEKYNGSPNKSGDIPYEFKSITVLSAGDRDPDSEGVEGMSASKMREAARNGDFETFKNGVPDQSLAKEMYDDVRTGLSIKNSELSLEEDIGGMPENSEIYVDMDGVLADFFGSWAKLMNVKHFTDIHKNHNIDDALQKIRDTEDFWLKLPMTSNAKNLLMMIKDIKGSYKILSSPLAGDPNSEPHKREWIKEHLGFFMPSDVIITHNKAEYATQEDGTPNILIDDYGVNIRAWEAAGGIGIKHKDHKFTRTVDALKSSVEEDLSEAKAAAKKAPALNPEDTKYLQDSPISDKTIDIVEALLSADTMKKYDMLFIIPKRGEAHARDRIQDDRKTGKYISAADIIVTFSKFLNRYGDSAHKKQENFKAVIHNNETNLNLVYVIDKNRDTGKMAFVLMTAMSKKDYIPAPDTNAVYKVNAIPELSETVTTVNEKDDPNYRDNYLNSDVTEEALDRLVKKIDEKTVKAFKKGFNMSVHNIVRSMDPRGESPLMMRDIASTLSKFFIQHAKDVYKNPKEFEGLIIDTENNINMPFVIKGPTSSTRLESDREGYDKILIQTVMVKKNFKPKNATDKVYRV